MPKYIERTKTITKTTIPEECIKAVKASQSLSEAVNQYEQKVGKLPAILDDSYRAIHNQSLTDINKLKSRQQDAASGSIAALVKLREMMQVTASEQRRCEAALK